MQKYRKRSTAFVTAIKLDLDTQGFEYHKWGDVQTCKPGDWLVDNHGDVYTVDADSFAQSYRRLSPGVYYKAGVVFAERSIAAGTIETREGVTHYEAGDYVVYNEADADDGYAVGRQAFEDMYEPVEQ